MIFNWVGRTDIDFSLVILFRLLLSCRQADFTAAHVTFFELDTHRSEEGGSRGGTQPNQNVLIVFFVWPPTCR